MLPSSVSTHYHNGHTHDPQRLTTHLEAYGWQRRRWRRGVEYACLLYRDSHISINWSGHVVALGLDAVAALHLLQSWGGGAL